VKRELLRILDKVLNLTNLSDPADIAAEVYQQLPVEQHEAVIQVLLREWVRVELGRSRATNRHQDLVSGATRAAALEGAQSQGEGKEKLPALPAHSPKVSAIRNAAPLWLNDRICVGRKTWKMKKDCTAEDLRYLANSRKDTAERLMSIATDFTRLAVLLKEHNVVTVGELPLDVLASFDMP